MLLLTHNFQVALRLQVLDSRVVHQADDRDPVVLPSHLQQQLAGHRVHVGPLLHLRLAWGREQRVGDGGGSTSPSGAIHPRSAGSEG